MTDAFSIDGRGPAITMPSGAVIDLLQPDPQTITLEDIATSSAKICRFAGHIDVPFSVAEHTVLATDLGAHLGASESELRAILLHDGHEAYVGDVIAPVRALIGPEFDALADRLDTAIGERFGIDPALFKSEIVQRVDHWSRVIEADRLAPWLHVPFAVRNQFPGLGTLPESVAFPAVGDWQAAAEVWLHTAQKVGLPRVNLAATQSAGRTV